jgi:hypothetical protein
MTADRDQVGCLSRPLARRLGHHPQYRRGKTRGDFLSVGHVLRDPLG